MSGRHKARASFWVKLRRVLGWDRYPHEAD
jgi:hypothetical protein